MKPLLQDLELSSVACAYVYFEKLVLKVSLLYYLYPSGWLRWMNFSQNMVNKANRRLVAGMSPIL